MPEVDDKYFDDRNELFNGAEVLAYRTPRNCIKELYDSYISRTLCIFFILGCISFVIVMITIFVFCPMFKCESKKNHHCQQKITNCKILTSILPLTLGMFVILFLSLILGFLTHIQTIYILFDCLCFVRQVFREHATGPLRYKSQENYNDTDEIELI